MKITKSLSLLLLAGPWGVSAIVYGQKNFFQRHIKPKPGSGSANTRIGKAHHSQYIDHKHPELGTFEQLYYYDLTNWAGPGSPIVFNTPGESALDYRPFFENTTMPGALAQAVGGALITMEHRYYGSSSPFEHLTTENLQYLTLQQVIADFVHFANHPNFPFDRSDSPSSAAKVPWVFTGCSYPGALAGWTASTSPGTFWAYQASSAVVESIQDFWEYFVPIEKGTPKACLEDIRLVVKHIDEVLKHGSPKDKEKLKAKFKLQDVSHDTDFAGAILIPIYNSQSAPIFGSNSFCNYVENVKHLNRYYPRYKKVGLEKALDGYAKCFTEKYLPHFCARSFGYKEFQGKYNTKCFNSYDRNNPIFTDTRSNNPFSVNRQYNWLACNQRVPFWSVAPPKGRPSIVSRLITTEYLKRQCGLFFPPGPQGQTFGSNGTNEVPITNHYTRGWEFTNSTRLVWGNSEFDPYRSSTVSSSFRPGGRLKSTPEHPVYIAKKAYHCGDFFRDKGVIKDFDAQVAHIKKWVAEFPSKNPDSPKERRLTWQGRRNS